MSEEARFLNAERQSGNRVRKVHEVRNNVKQMQAIQQSEIYHVDNATAANDSNENTE